MIFNQLIQAASGGEETNIVTGSFTTGSTLGATESIEVPYNGSGKPRAIIVEVQGGGEGAYAKSRDCNVSDYDYATNVGAVTQYMAISTYPNYGYGPACGNYRASNSTTTSRGIESVGRYYIFGPNTAANYAYGVIKLYESTTLKWQVTSGSSGKYGLIPDTVYDYLITYSE